jgi:hypothetical protein
MARGFTWMTQIGAAARRLGDIRRDPPWLIQLDFNQCSD